MFTQIFKEKGTQICVYCPLESAVKNKFPQIFQLRGRYSSLIDQRYFSVLIRVKKRSSRRF
jgi:hypothetical protein